MSFACTSAFARDLVLQPRPPTGRFATRQGQRHVEHARDGTPL
jgi:hypothetical protein